MHKSLIFTKNLQVFWFMYVDLIEYRFGSDVYGGFATGLDIGNR